MVATVPATITSPRAFATVLRSISAHCTSASPIVRWLIALAVPTTTRALAARPKSFGVSRRASTAAIATDAPACPITAIVFHFSPAIVLAMRVSSRMASSAVAVSVVTVLPEPGEVALDRALRLHRHRRAVSGSGEGHTRLALHARECRHALIR